MTTPAQQLLNLCRKKGVKLATAESCTGGKIIATLTEIPGSSDVVDRGFITYSNQSKIEMLGVPASLIKTKGAVSKEVAIAMAKGAIKNSNADIAIAVTGIAGPTGASKNKPVGLVHMAIATRTTTRHYKKIFPGTRKQVQKATVQFMLLKTQEDLKI